ncbi:MAG: 4Fe-4S dicluster domain-containing protein [Chloroflexi bacterium]|nr:4Fe-4S dicluster domain-containing protein [Chloroflexota bacterium]
MRKMLFIDADKCTGCRMCTMACSLSKTETFNPARSRISILRWEEEGIMQPIVCHHCENPPCIKACPVDAISKNKETGLVAIDQPLCIGCKVCIMECPFGGFSLDPVENIVTNCDLCGGNPECVAICPTGALTYVTADRTALMRRRGAMEKLGKSLGALVPNEAYSDNLVEAEANK